jgi:hypothetical protein
MDSAYSADDADRKLSDLVENVATAPVLVGVLAMLLPRGGGGRRSRTVWNRRRQVVAIMGDATRWDATRRRACDDIAFSFGDVWSAPSDKMQWRSTRGGPRRRVEEEGGGGEESGG